MSDTWDLNRLIQTAVDEELKRRMAPTIDQMVLAAFLERGGVETWLRTVAQEMINEAVKRAAISLVDTPFSDITRSLRTQLEAATRSQAEALAAHLTKRIREAIHE